MGGAGRATPPPPARRGAPPPPRRPRFPRVAAAPAQPTASVAEAAVRETVPVTLLLLSTADTDLLAARAVEDPALQLRLANPARVEDATVLLDDVRLVLVRLLGGR